MSTNYDSVFSCIPTHRKIPPDCYPSLPNPILLKISKMPKMPKKTPKITKKPQKTWFSHKTPIIIYITQKKSTEEKFHWSPPPTPKFLNALPQPNLAPEQSLRNSKKNQEKMNIQRTKKNTKNGFECSSKQEHRKRFKEQTDRNPRTLKFSSETPPNTPKAQNPQPA